MRVAVGKGQLANDTSERGKREKKLFYKFKVAFPRLRSNCVNSDRCGWCRAEFERERKRLCWCISAFFVVTTVVFWLGSLVSGFLHDFVVAFHHSASHR